MPATTRCKVCNARKELRAEIEQKIAAEMMSHEQAAALVGCHCSSVTRHVRNHMPKSLKTAISLKHVDPEASLNVAEQLQESHGHLRQIFKQCIASGNVKLALRALEVEVKQLTLAGKLQGQFSDAPQVVNLLQSPSFVQVRKLIIESLADQPERLPEVSARIDEILEGDSRDC
jgi:predicted XRE-type DNA-binding protein